MISGMGNNHLIICIKLMMMMISYDNLPVMYCFLVPKKKKLCIIWWYFKKKKIIIIICFVVWIFRLNWKSSCAFDVHPASRILGLVETCIALPGLLIYRWLNCEVSLRLICHILDMNKKIRFPRWATFLVWNYLLINIWQGCLDR